MAFDVFMMTYGESNAEENWARLQQVAPHARRIENVQGLVACYAACAAAAATPYFFAVDGDNWILDDFRFELAFAPAPDEIAHWHAVNPVNGLRYTHGGIKLFPTALFADAARWRDLPDFSTMVARNRYTEVCATEHRFNADPYAAWSGAFRECVKLAFSTTVSNAEHRVRARRRLEAWCERGAKQKNGEWCLRGARTGRDYGFENSRNRQGILAINDYAWLRARFDAVQAKQRAPISRYDVFMIVYGESNAAENWARLSAIMPSAKRIENVPGMSACFTACAAAATTPHFFTVDADNWILDDFRFEVPFEPSPDEVAVWYADNPVNGLRYGHGAIKLFPKAMFAGIEAGHRLPDFATMIASRNRYTEICASEHRFNADPYAAWAGAFRESAKLAIGTTVGKFKSRAVAQHRLEAWCAQGAEAKNGQWCLRGAREGRDFGFENSRNEAQFLKINNYAWLRDRFRRQHVRKIAMPPLPKG